MQTPMADPKRSLFAAAIASAVGVGLLLVACEQDELPTELPLSPDPAAVISDGARGGNPDFFFLPPLVPDPTGHENWDDGGFNPNYSPEVRICPGHPTESCDGAGAVARFTMTQGTGSEVVRVSRDDEHYIVNWDTGNVPDDTREYSIRVLVNGAELGFVDIILGSNRDLKEMRNSKTGDVVPLKDGRTVPIKFRIEYTLCDPDDEECVEQIVSASQDNLVKYGENTFFLPAQDDGVYYVLNEAGETVAVPYLVYSISPCESGLSGATVSECLTIEPDKPLAQPLQNAATISFCELAWDPSSLNTVFRRDDDGLERPLPHVEHFCEEEEAIPQAEARGFWGYVLSGLKSLQHPIVRVLRPAPLHADPPVVMHRGKGGLSDLTSDFQVIDVGQMNKFAGLLSWWSADGHFYDIYGESISPVNPIEVDRNNATPVGEVGFAGGIYNEAFSPAWEGQGDPGYLQAPVNGLDPEEDGYVDELTVSAWAKLNSIPAHSEPLNLVSLLVEGESPSVGLGIGSAGELRFSLRTEGGCGESSSCRLIVPNLMQTSCFHHVVGTFNGDDVVLYLDGQEVARETVNETPDRILLPEGTEFRFGPLDGLLDEITVYRTGLSSENIQSIYDAGGEAKCESPVSELALYEVNSSSDGLSTVDVATGNATFIGELDPDPAIFVAPVAMAVRPSDGQIFAWNNSNTEQSTGVLLTVDACTGLATPVNVDAEPGGDLQSIAHPSSGNIIFGAGQSADGMLYSISTIDGSKTVIGPHNLSPTIRVGGMDFHPTTGVLWGVELASPNNRIVTIDTSNGAATVVSTLVDPGEDPQNPAIGSVQSIVFDAAGTMIGSGYQGTLGAVLFDIDPSTGAVSNIRNVTGGSIPQGMGFAPTCSQ